MCVSGAEKKKKVRMERILKVNSEEIVTDFYFYLPELELHHC